MDTISYKTNVTGVGILLLLAGLALGAMLLKINPFPYFSSWQFSDYFLVIFMAGGSLLCLYYGLIYSGNRQEYFFDKQTQTYVVKKSRGLISGGMEVDSGKFKELDCIVLRHMVAPILSMYLQKKDGKRIFLKNDSKDLDNLSLSELKGFINELLAYCEFFQVGFRVEAPFPSKLANERFRKRIFRKFLNLKDSKWNLERD